MITETDQNYLKETYALQLEHDHVTTSMLADRVGASAATVTGMLKKLAERQWVAYEPYKGVTLTETGRSIALEVVRHHRLLETYLSKALGIPWDKVHDEAERLEHVISEYLESRIDELLDHPAIDPHGSPIPAHDGSIRESARLHLTDVRAGTDCEIVEVSDRDPGLLARLDRLKLHPGTRLQVLGVEPIDGLITLRVATESLVLGSKTASQVIVRIIKESHHGRVQQHH